MGHRQVAGSAVARGAPAPPPTGQTEEKGDPANPLVVGELAGPWCALGGQETMGHRGGSDAPRCVVVARQRADEARP